MRTAGYLAEGQVLDVTDRVAAQAFVTASNPFDILVNSAGGSRHADFLEVSEADYQAVIDLNLKAALFVSQAVASKLVETQRAGSIIHISSQMGHVGGPKRTVYAASKFAVEGLLV